MLQPAIAGNAPLRPLPVDSPVTAAIVEALVAFDPEGLTTAEVVTLTGHRRTSISARICELEKIGLVAPTGQAEPIPHGGLPARKYRVAGGVQ